MKRFLAALVIGFLVASVSWAESRTWTSSNGQYTIEAELLDFKDGKAQLKRSDGKQIDVPLLSLGAGDREYVKRQFPGAEEQQFRPGAEYREWKTKTGKFTTMAEFLGCADGKVQLRKLDGVEIAVQRTLLSPDDQRFVADELRRLREEDEEAAAATKTAEEEPAEQLGQQDIPMKLLRLDQPKGKARSKTAAPADYLLRLTAPQQFFLQLGRGGGAGEANFQRVIQKEPKYLSPMPFRGVAKLGSREYGFALDAAGPQAAGYNKLYFDINGNGDLTDERPVAASEVRSPAGSGTSQSQFPRVDLTIEANGTSIEYAFLIGAICHQSPSEAYATVSLYAAAVREGYITEGKKRTRLVLVDRNSNGRFDDAMAIRSAGVAPEGDLLLINPNSNDRLSTDASMGRDRHFVSKTVCIGSHFYRMEVPPSGETLKLSPTTLVLGNVTNPSPTYRAVLFSNDYGVLMLGGTKDQKIPLPEGAWKIANYTIDATAATGGSRTAVAATFGADPPAVTVGSGETAKLPFGAPYRAVVTGRRTGASTVYLSLAIVGAAGEQCTSFYVNGSKPPQPRFVIKDKDGKTVHQGNFEYG